MGPLQLQTSLARVAKRKRGGQLTDRSQPLAEIPRLPLGFDGNDETRSSGAGVESSFPERSLDVESIPGSAVAPPVSSFFVTRPAGRHQLQTMQPLDVPPELVDGLRPNPPPRDLTDLLLPATGSDPEADEKTERIRRWLQDTKIASNQ